MKIFTSYVNINTIKTWLLFHNISGLDSSDCAFITIYVNTHKTRYIHFNYKANQTQIKHETYQDDVYISTVHDMICSNGNIYSNLIALEHRHGSIIIS